MEFTKGTGLIASSSSAQISNPELVFGLLGPIGVNLDLVVNELSSSLKSVSYDPVTIHLTDHMVKNARLSRSVDRTSYYDRYRSLIDVGNEYRHLAENHAAMAGLAIMLIREERARRNAGNDTEPALSTAYIIRQFKRAEEIELMRSVYGRKFILVSLYGSEDERRTILMDKIRRFDSSPKSDADCERQAIQLIDTDYLEKEVEEGQRVSEGFHLADVFVDGVNSSRAPYSVSRFVDAFFGHTKCSPTKKEYGMYSAAAAGLRSADLSRQVGAAIFTQDGEAIAIGCNEVPKARGGTYWIDETNRRGAT